jgi:hypothetical protein
MYHLLESFVNIEVAIAAIILGIGFVVLVFPEKVVQRILNGIAYVVFYAALVIIPMWLTGRL